MPKQDETPNKLRPYQFHGIDLSYRAGDKDAYGKCVFCDRENKFSINIESGQYRCVVCEEVGNIYILLRKLHALSYEATTDSEYKELAADRKLYTDETLVHWQLAKSITTGDWILPAYNAKGSLVGLYRYIHNGERTLLMPTPTLGLHLFGMHLWEDSKKIVYLCEGWSDALCLWETLGMAKESDTGLVQTGNPQASLLANANVIAITAAMTFKEEWNNLFGGKIVNLMGQNDHERKHPKTGKRIAPASYDGMMKISKLLEVADHPPAQVNLLYWGDKGFNPDLNSGYDLRDFITQGV